MDVRCERCRAQYVFDDAQITEAGLTVQCSNCGHLFKVKKKALVVTVPVKPGEAGEVPAITPSPSPALSAAGAPAPGASPEKKEWRVRQANGNVFTFKELTTLQKWIVERKVSRDDEISLSGDQWKRLGNIAELATFFQVVEAADRSQAQAAPQALTPLPMPTVLPSGPGGYPLGFQQPTYPPPAAHPAAAHVPPAGGPAPSISAKGAASAAWEAQAPSAPRAAAPEPAWTSGVRVDLDDELGQEELRAVKGGGGGKVVVLLLVLAIGGAAAVWFLKPDWVPESLRALVAQPPAPAPNAPAAQAPVPVAAKPEPPPPPPPAPVATPPREEPPPPVEKAPVMVQEETVKEAPKAVTEAPKVAREAPKAAREPPKPKGVKALLSEARKLREHGKTEKALDLFGRAADLDPENAEALAGRGWCYLDLSQYAPAEASFQGALDQEPDHAEALIGLAETYRYEGRRTAALKFYQRYLAIHPGGDDAVAARNAIEQLKE